MPPGVDFPSSGFYPQRLGFNSWRGRYSQYMNVRDDEVNRTVPTWVHFEAKMGPEMRDALMCEMANPLEANDQRRVLHFFQFTDHTVTMTTDPVLASVIMRIVNESSFDEGDERS